MEFIADIASIKASYTYWEMDDKIPFRKVIGHHWGHAIPAQTMVDFEINFSLLKPWNPANQIMEWRNGIFDFEADWEDLTANNCVQIMIKSTLVIKHSIFLRK